MFYENNLKFFIEHVDKVEAPVEIQLLSSKDKYSSTYMLYMCHQNKEKYIVMCQSSNVICYKAEAELIKDIFPEHA